MATSTSAVTSPSECEEGTVSGLSAGLETMEIGTAKAVDEGTVSSLRTGPDALAIGTAKAFEKGYEYHYRTGRVGAEFVYRCTRGSDFSSAGEILYIVCEDGYYVAHDGWVNDENRLTLRQPVFVQRTISARKVIIAGSSTMRLTRPVPGQRPIGAVIWPLRLV